MAMNDHVDHAMFEQIFGALEAFGQLFADRLLDHPLAGKADECPRLGDLHMYGSLTRFIPPEVAGCFERVAPAAAAAAPDGAAAPGPVVDVAGLAASMWS